MTPGPLPQRLQVEEHSTLTEIAQSCENLINQTQSDLELFQHEQNKLRAQILGILEENQRLNTKLEVLKSLTNADATKTGAGTGGDSRDDATREKLTKEAIKNVQLQIDYLQAENKELRLLNVTSRKTIQNLEHEIQNYRIQIFKPNSIGEIKQKYATTIKLLESTIKSQKTELNKQNDVIESLFEQKNSLHDSLKALQEHVKAKDSEFNSSSVNNEAVKKIQDQLTEATRRRKDLEKSLKLSKRIIEERFEREKHALQKVQEALSIAEAAVADKEDAQKREQVVKEECDHLASTIGQVMDEASRKVEQDIESLKKKYAEKEKLLMEKQAKLNDELLNHKKFNEILETRCNRFEQKYKDGSKDKEKLTKELQVAMKTIEEMEIKLAANENLLHADKQAKKLADEHEHEIQHLMSTYKQSKDKYRMAIEDVTKKFEKEIYRLQNENANLKAENQVIKMHHEYAASEAEGS